MKFLRFHLLLLCSIGSIAGIQIASVLLVQQTAYGYTYHWGDLNRGADWLGQRIKRYRPGDLNSWADTIGLKLHSRYLNRHRRPAVSVRYPDAYRDWGSN